MEIQRNRFTMKHNESWIEKESPFQQARTNKAVLIEILNRNKIWDILVTLQLFLLNARFLKRVPDAFWHLGMED